MKIIFIALVIAPCTLYAQDRPGTALHIKKAKGEITLDGKLDEVDWKSAQVANDWFLNYPVDTIASPFQTEARVTFDDQYFYVSGLRPVLRGTGAALTRP